MLNLSREKVARYWTGSTVFMNNLSIFCSTQFKQNGHYFTLINECKVDWEISLLKYCVYAS